MVSIIITMRGLPVVVVVAVMVVVITRRSEREGRSWRGVVIIII